MSLRLVEPVSNKIQGILNTPHLVITKFVFNNLSKSVNERLILNNEFGRKWLQPIIFPYLLGDTEENNKDQPQGHFEMLLIIFICLLESLTTCLLFGKDTITYTDVMQNHLIAFKYILQGLQE